MGNRKPGSKTSRAFFVFNGVGTQWEGGMNETGRSPVILAEEAVEKACLIVIASGDGPPLGGTS